MEASLNSLSIQIKKFQCGTEVEIYLFVRSDEKRHLLKFTLTIEQQKKSE